MNDKILSARLGRRARVARLFARFATAVVLCAGVVLAMALAAPLFAATANPAGPVADMPPIDDRLGKSDDNGWSDLSGPTFLFNSGTPVTSPFGVCGGCYAWSSTYYKSPTDFDLTARRFTVPVSSTATAFRIWWAYGNDAPKPNNANKGGVAADFSGISLDLYSDVAGVPGALITNLAGTWSLLDAGTNYREYKLAAPYTFTSGSYFVSIRAVTAKPNYDATLVWMMCAPSDPLIDYIDYTNANNGTTGGWFAYTGLSPCPADQNFGLQVLSSDIITPGPVTSCISADSTCITVPVKIARTTSDPMRGFSVSFTLSAELDLCTTVGGSITEGTYLSSIGGTNFQVVPLGGDSYTVDCAILGLPCGATAATGTLFNVRVKKSGSDGTGTVTVDSVLARDCSNAPIAATPGAPLSITIDTGAPAAVTNLSASQVKTGNDGDGTTKVTLTFTVPGDAAVAEVYRAPWGGYPEYDDAGFAAAPATPAYPPGSPWTLTAVTATTQTDEIATRDFWYYVMFTKDACGNVSAVSNKTTGTLNYHLGDTHNGTTNCVGNNLVNTSDITHLGGNYGVTGLVLNDPRNCLDVGPTTDFSVDARPTTDNKIQFEDLIMFAINYGQVSKTNERPAAAAEDGLTLVADGASRSEGMLTARLEASGTGRVQGISTRLSWDPAVVTPVSVAAGELLERNGGVAFTPEPGVVDAAVLGTAGGGLSGRGTLATVEFRVIGAGDPRIALASVDARDAANTRVEVGMKLALPGRETASVNRTELLPNIPNPFNPMTKVAFRLATAGPASLSIFTADGRRVRTLAQGSRPAGLYEINWDGRDDRGAEVSSGTYYSRLETADGMMSRPLTLLR